MADKPGDADVAKANEANNEEVIVTKEIKANVIDKIVAADEAIVIEEVIIVVDKAILIDKVIVVDQAILDDAANGQ